MSAQKPHMINGHRRYMSKGQRPCDFCRTRKTACRIETGPPCRMCQLHGQSCTFGDGGIRASHRQHGENNSLTNGLSNITVTPAGQSTLPEQQQSASAHTPAQQFTETHILGPVQDGGDYGSPLVLSTPRWEQLVSEFMDSGALTPPSADVGDELNARITPESAALDQTLPDTVLGSDGIESTPQFMGTTGEFEPHLVNRYIRDASGRLLFRNLTLQSVQSGPVPSHFWFTSQSLYSKSRQDTGLPQARDEGEKRKVLESMISSGVGRRLIRLFDRFIAPHYPIFSDRSRPSPSSSPIYLLAALYAAVQPFAQHEDSLSFDLAFKPSLYSDLLTIAYEALEFELHAPTLPVVQTLVLLLAQPTTHHLMSESSLQRTLLGKLVSAAHTLGLHVDPGQWPIAPWQIAQRRRISFIVFSIDTWVSCSLGSPPLINRENWLIESLTVEDELDAGLRRADWEALLHQSQLTSLLREVLMELQ